MKCRVCGDSKPPESFPLNRGSSSGRQAYCKPCHAAAQRARKIRDPERYRRVEMKAFLLLNYGLTVEAYEEMLARQGGVCAICGEHRTLKRQNRLHVDHDHVTRRVRGLLCSRCNSAVGMLADNPDRARCLAVYLESNQ